jgi:hypothetical protein
VIGYRFPFASSLLSKACVDSINNTSASATEPLHAFWTIAAAEEGLDFVVKDLSLSGQIVDDTFLAQPAALKSGPP